MEFYYHSKVNGSDVDHIEDLDFSEEFLNHIFCITILERLATSLSRGEYNDSFNAVKYLMSIPKEQRNKSKYVLTSHPTQPNSMGQVVAVQEILKAMEESDDDHLHHSMILLIESTMDRQFKKPSYLDESNIYHSIIIPNTIKAFSYAFEVGLRDIGDFFENLGTWITYDFDNHPEMSVGIMSHTHGLNLELTINCYIQIINEANIMESKEIQEVMELLHRVISYSKKLREISELVIKKKINKNEFFKDVPIVNVHGIELQVIKLLETVQKKKGADSKVSYVAEKLLKLMKAFSLNCCLGQIRLAGEQVTDLNSINELIHDLFKEISILNSNTKAVEMLIIANYVHNSQYENIQQMISKYNVQGIEIVPLLETFSSYNDTDSNITMLASSDTRQRDGMLLTELRVFREYLNNPEKHIYMGQGNPAERGGGPYTLQSHKAECLTRNQRKRHIRTVQGFYMINEGSSRDILFNNMIYGAMYVNKGKDFEPTTDYMDFLFDLDSTVGVPTREMMKTKEFNDLYVKNPNIKALVNMYDYAGSRELGKKLVEVKKTRAIVQAYINSDRCSYCHPELAFWDQLSTEQIQQIIRYYFSNNSHLKYVLYNLGFMVRRFDLDFAVSYAKMDPNNKYFGNYVKGRATLEKLLDHLGIGYDSTPVNDIYKEHLGLSDHTSNEELVVKENAFKNVFKIQSFVLAKYLSESDEAKKALLERKLKMIQTTLSNFSSFNGKG
eukprot:CAMPEP_0170523182 /NCGR_PEP_ID=MMETSP0209-20121228/8611_1 /TAXON_ID=665100 ORGANISM="Litonotus pictus, Strain P1" /NCGR_SAMPLE_ID=MMETSP0209 /ASSEMBLY_ACC=CAM_ASM_000301 /LENGTH=726 /DNA_ID=CAMNT_0010811129 /DNA_START=418 /DNA_END=2601 /DNA_ORIENTATION=-